MKVLVIFVLLGFLAASANANKVTVQDEFGATTDYCKCPTEQEYKAPEDTYLDTYESEVWIEGLITVYCWTDSSNCNNFDTSGRSADMVRKSSRTCCRNGAKSWMRKRFKDCYSC